MKESHGKDLASHPDPESCAGGREVTGEALTGAHAGQPSSREIKKSGVPTPLRVGRLSDKEHDGVLWREQLSRCKCLVLNEKGTNREPRKLVDARIPVPSAELGLRGHFQQTL